MNDTQKIMTCERSVKAPYRKQLIIAVAFTWWSPNNRTNKQPSTRN